MNPFKIPSTNYQDQYDLARFKLTWRICLFMAFVLMILVVVFFYLDQFVLYPTSVGVLLAIGMLFILWKQRDYRLVSILFSITGTILCQFTLLAYPGEYHFVDLLWIMIITLYAYFALGKIWGTITLIMNTVGIVVFVMFIANQSLQLVTELNQGQVISLSANFVICASIIAYLIFQFLDTIKRAEKELIELNDQLERKNEMVEAQNEQKTVMLKEIHHRVKNNLQVITSLLRLQAHEISDHSAKEKFNESVQRVMSMSLIHEKMYQSEDLSRIDLKEYLNSLAQELLLSYNIKKPIALNISSSIDHVKPKSVVSLGLIINELISNSLKHAFNEKENGLIDMRFNQPQEGTIEFGYADDGVWKTPYRQDSFGLELIESLTEQLEGEVQRDTQDGTRYTFKFQLENLQ